MAKDTLRLTVGDYDLHGDVYARVHCVRVFFAVAADAYPTVFDDFETCVVDGDLTAAAVSGWSNRHALHGPTVEPTAIETALTWRADADRRRRREWCASTLLSVMGRPIVPAVDAIRPDPLNEHRDGWLVRAAAAWDAQCELLHKVGFARAAVKSSPEHFTWLAHRTIGRRSFSEIARGVHKDRKTVSGAIRDLAALVGLELPPVES